MFVEPWVLYCLFLCVLFRRLYVTGKPLLLAHSLASSLLWIYNPKVVGAHTPSLAKLIVFVPCFFLIGMALI